MSCVTSGAEENPCVLRIRTSGEEFGGFRLFGWKNIHDNQRDRVLPYQFEPEPGMEASDSDDKSDSKEERESSNDEVDHMF